MSPDFTFYDYDSGRDGQIVSGTTVTSAWFDSTGISSIVLRGAFTAGTTTIFVDQGRENTGAGLVSSADLKASVITDAGAAIPVTYQFVRIRIVQATANTTNAQLSAKGRNV